jgi:multidrug efflux pump subunit AcrA (membrane-fusion protein)
VQRFPVWRVPMPEKPALAAEVGRVRALGEDRLRFRLRHGLFGLAAVAVVATGAWYLAGWPFPGSLAAERGRGEKAAAASAPRPELEVSVVAAERATVPRTFEYTGVIVSPKDATLRPRVTGTVVERPFEPGSHVDKGAVLFRIDPRPFEVALQAAQAQLEQAKAQLAFARVEVARIEPLQDQGFASQQRLQ